MLATLFRVSAWPGLGAVISALSMMTVMLRRRLAVYVDSFTDAYFCVMLGCSYVIALFVTAK